MSAYNIFTSESVSVGHPDKICDQISDAILDEVLKQDKNARVAVETLVKNGVVILAGELSTSAWVDVEQIARNVIIEAGYNSSKLGFDGNTCGIINIIGKQSPEIAQGVDKKDIKNQGAGDQGLMFGYATNETENYMPIPIDLSHKLILRQQKLRKSIQWLRPDCKAQITYNYETKKIEAIVLSTQHDENIEQDVIYKFVKDEIINKVIPSEMLNSNTLYHINPTGKFVIGGPVGDCGLTGRKIIVDTYGGIARHGGGAFSGKDPSKVDRSGAYMARYIAKNIVAANLADKCEIQISYAIGIAKPTSISIDTFGTNKISNNLIIKKIQDNFDLRPYAIIKNLNLLSPIYQITATGGHFGRKPQDNYFPWEKLDKVDDL